MGIKELYEIYTLHEIYNKHTFNESIDIGNDTYKICGCGKLYIDQSKAVLTFDKTTIEKLNKYFNENEINLLKYLLEINEDSTVDLDLFLKLNKNDMIEIFKIELKNKEIYYPAYHFDLKMDLLKDYITIDLLKKSNKSKYMIDHFIEQFILIAPEKATIDDINNYLNKRIKSNLYNLLTLDLDKIKQIKEIKCEDYGQGLHFNCSPHNINEIYKDKYFFDKMYYIEKITGMSFLKKEALEIKAINEFRLFYIIKNKLYSLFKGITLKAHNDKINCPISFIKYLEENTISELDRQIAKLIRIEKAPIEYANFNNVFILGDQLYSYDFQLDKLTKLLREYA